MKKKIMKKKKGYRTQVVITVVGMVVWITIAIFCYRSIQNMIIENEQGSLKSLAKVNAQSLLSSLETKSKMIYAALSGDMNEVGDIEKGILKLGEKGIYIPIDGLDQKETWEQELCGRAGANPGMVIEGPVRKSEEGYYIFCITKAVYIHGSIAGYVRIELNLDEIYDEEQALSSLQLENDGYCIVKGADGTTIMPSYYEDEDISFSYSAGNGCSVETVYEAKDGIPQESQKLIAYETVEMGEEEFTLCILEDYDKVTQPIERMAFYFFLLGAVLLIWTIGFIYNISQQQKKEALLVKELQHEKTMNEAMKKQEGLMEKYNHSRTMSVLTGSIAHEFNNLMTPIVLYADLLEENEVVFREMSEEITELKSATKRCEELAKQLLSYSRQGKAEKVLTDYDATFAVNEAVNMVRKLLPDQVELKENICKTSYYIHGQVGTLNQILLNLTTNAIHAMKNGGTLSIQFGLSTDCEQEVRLIVEDTGTGIPSEIQRQVFHPFFTTKQAGEGTGIGLTVVKRLTEEHGGSIRVKTKVGKGTKFILDFPRVENRE